MAEEVARTSRGLIHIDCAYTVENIRARRHESFYEARHRGGYFARVLGVNPLAGLLGNRRGERIRIVRFSPRQIVLDGFDEGGQLPKWRVPFHVLWAQFRLFRLLLKRARRPDYHVIFAVDPFYTGLLALLLSRLSGKPFAVAIYANQDELYEATGAIAYPRLLRSRRIELMVQRLVLSRADLIEAPTRNMRDYVLRHGARRDRIELLPVVKYVVPAHFKAPGTRPDPAAFLESRNIPIDRLYLLTVSRLLKLKHVDQAVLAMAEVLKHSPGTIGIIAGEGPMRTELEAMIDGFGLRDRLFLPGNVDQEMLSALIPHAITLSPLTGMALIETSLGGSPPIVYDRDWQPEFVQDGKNGFVVPYEDHLAMAARARLLVEDAELRRRLGDRARSDALEFADPATHDAKEKRAFDRLFAGHDGRA